MRHRACVLTSTRQGVYSVKAQKSRIYRHVTISHGGSPTVGKAESHRMLSERLCV
jgi:hypothetical protein